MSTAETVIAPPLAGTWKLDPAHTTIGFVARHLMVTRVRGGFGQFEGKVVVGDPLESSSAEVVIQAGSIGTGEPNRDGHLRSADFFDAESHPAITFRATGVRPAASGRYTVTGDLTIRDVTKPVELDVEYFGTEQMGDTVKAGFAATTEIDREQWGLTWNKPLASGGVLVGKTIRIEIEGELDKVG